MNITLQQLKVFIESLRHLIRCEEKRIRDIENVQTGIIFGYYKLGDMTPDLEEQRSLWAQADKEEAWVDDVLRKWIYQKFYLEELLAHLKTKLRELQKAGGRHAIAA